MRKSAPGKKMYGREGMMERGNEIGVHVIRGGDIVGDHKVMFSKNFETIEISSPGIRPLGLRNRGSSGCPLGSRQETGNLWHE